MKQTVIIILTTVLSMFAAKAQTWGEWVNQKKTQKEYLVKQIAALQTYISYGRKGYKIAKDGLNFIGDAKNAEVNFHKDYFNSLKLVSAAVSNDNRIVQVITLQDRIALKIGHARAAFLQSGELQGNEKDHISSVLAQLSEDCTRILEELSSITKNGQLEMKDDERIRAIEHLYVQMRDNYSFCTLFINETKILVQARLKEANDLKTGHALNGIKE